jgi:2,3-bisphosphoglycerate-dependent phosphoglycerate mutase/probable phosphoglycerate mutase
MADRSMKGHKPVGAVWLVRHTETDWNRSGRYQSHSDRPLTRRGVAHLRAVAESFRTARVALVVSTGLVRTDRLAAAIAGQHEHAAHVRDRCWAEVDHGRWEGLTYAEVAEQFGDSATERFRDTCRSRAHGGETLEELAARVWRAWQELPRTEEGACVVVAHATPIQALLCRILQIPLDRYWQMRIDLGSISHVRIDTAGPSVQSLNHVPQLPVRNRRPRR